MIDLDNRFDYHRPRDEETVRKHEKVRDDCKYLASIFDENLPESREKSLALTKVEEAMMWANAAIARNRDA